MLPPYFSRPSYTQQSYCSFKEPHHFAKLKLLRWSITSPYSSIQNCISVKSHYCTTLRQKMEIGPTFYLEFPLCAQKKFLGLRNKMSLTNATRMARGRELLMMLINMRPFGCFMSMHIRQTRTTPQNPESASHWNILWSVQWTTLRGNHTVNMHVCIS